MKQLHQYVMAAFGEQGDSKSPQRRWLKELEEALGREDARAEQILDRCLRQGVASAARGFAREGGRS